MKKTVNVGGIPVGADYPALVIGEIGINANGVMDIAMKLIDVAADVGCGAVKFQKRDVNKVFSADALAKSWAGGMPAELLQNAIARGVLQEENVRRLRATNFSDVTEGDFRWTIEFTEEEFKQIDAYCKKKEIIWYASPWDMESVDVLERLGVPCYKVASASISDHPLLKHIRSKGKPVILATGISEMNEVDAAVDILGRENLIILHCVSTYPSEDSELNLRVIHTLQNRFPGVPVGYSGHERGVATSVAAVALGACMVERHITLDRGMYGPDQAASVDPENLRIMVRDIRSVEAALGDGVKRFLDRERPVRKMLETRSS